MLQEDTLIKISNIQTSQNLEFGRKHDTLLKTTENLIIYQVGTDNVKEFTQFVYGVYAKDYKQKYGWEASQEELLEMMSEDQFYSPNAYFVAIKSLSGKTLGTVRLTKKASKDIVFPIEKEFGIDVQELYDLEGNAPNDIWHCGRLAIDKDALKEENIQMNSIKLLKALLEYVGIVNTQKQYNVLTIEADESCYKLLKVLGTNIQIVGDGKEYLGSMTYPAAVFYKDAKVWCDKHLNI